MSFVRKAFLVTGTRLVSTCVQVVAGIIFARALGPDGTGRFALFRTAVMLATTIAGLGLGNANIFLLNRRQCPSADIVTISVKFGTIISLALAAALAVCFSRFSGYFGDADSYVIVIFSLAAGSQLLLGLLRPVLAARLDARRMVAVDITEALAMLMGGAGLMLVGRLNVNTALLVLAGDFVAPTLLVLLFLRRDIHIARPFEWRLFREMLVYGVRLAAANILLLLSGQVTLFLLRLLGRNNFDDVGLYSRAVGVAGLIALVPSAIGQLVYSKWSTAQGDDRRLQAEKAGRLYCSYGLVSAALTALFAKHILWIMYGPEFVPAAGSLRILVFGMLLFSVATITINLLAGDGRAGITAWVLAGAVAVNASATLLLVPALGIIGAALASVCGQLFLVAATLAVCRRLYGLRLVHLLMLKVDDVRYVWNAIRRRQLDVPAPPTVAVGFGREDHPQ